MKFIGIGFGIGACLLAMSGVASAKKIDFNNDGNADILWFNVNTLALSTGTSPTGGTSVNVSVSPGWQAVGEGDFNQDGHTDIVWHNGASGETQIHFMNGVSLSSVNPLDSSLNIPDNTGWKIVGTDDFNGDGRPDILWHRSSGESQVWFMNGATRTGAMNLDTIPDPTGWQIVGTGDFDGDSKTDILWHKSSTGEIQVWYMNGTALRFSDSVDLALAMPDTLGSMIVGIDDFNGDGHPDLLWHNGATGGTWIWLMDGLTLTTVQGLSGNFPDSTGWRIVDGSTEVLLPGDLMSFGFQSMVTNYVDASATHSLPSYEVRPTVLIVAAFRDPVCAATPFGPSPGALRHSASYYENLVFGPTGANVNGWLNAQSSGRAGLQKVQTIVLNDVPGSPVADDANVLGGLLVLASNTLNFAPYDTNNDGTVASSELNVIVVSNYHAGCLNGDLGANRFVQQSSVSGKVYGGPVAEYEENVAFDVATHEELHSWGARDIYDFTPNLPGESSIMGTSRAGVDGTTQYAVDSLHKFLLGWAVPSQIIDLTQFNGFTIPLSSLDSGPALISYNNAHEYILLENRNVGPYQANTGVGVMAWPVLLNSSDLQPNQADQFMPTYTATPGGSSVTVNWMSSGTAAITYSVQSDGSINITRAF